MAGEQAEALTIDEAKQHLRELAREGGMSAWVRRRPLRAVACGFVAGIFLASSPRTQDLLVRGLSHQLLKSLF
ncbi:MAG: hypothetical protein RQ899_10560 [Pseudomonadales bacterium]|nr:hypothetical protein [Pseudomonadales bacterium]